MTTSRQCRICETTAEHPEYDIREMLMATREVFHYFQCQECGCLQIEQVPDDLGKYYPSNYFAYKLPRRLIKGGMRAWIDPIRVRSRLSGSNLLAKLTDRLVKPLDYLDWAIAAGADQAAPVLDVGCGRGKLLLRMRLGGFTNLTGVDPFLDKSIDYPNGVHIHKQELADFARVTESRYQMIMFHHSYEHMLYPHQVMQAAEQLLAPDGLILIRVPVADSWAWRHYRENWFAADAPRHLFLHTKKSIGILAAEAGLKIDNIVYDSTPSQFIISELYSRDIPLTESSQIGKLFSRQEITRFRTRTKEFNRTAQGDQAVFYLKRQ